MSSKLTKVGITGGIGSGKSFVAEMIEKMGYPVFYSDYEAKQIIANDVEVQSQIIALLGEESYIDGKYNIPFVSQKVFSDNQLREQLNAIVHPAVRQAFEKWAIAKSEYSDIVFNEAAIMIESGAYRGMDQIILVSAPLDVRIQRVIARDSISEDHAKARIAAQSSDEFKRPYVQFEVINDGRALLPQLNSIMDSIRL